MKEFSIAETLNYYAWLHGLTKEELEMRKSKLYALLEIPPESSRIDQLR